MIRAALALMAVLAAMPARGESVAIPGADGFVLRGELHLPAGGAPGIAVVALHGCGGPFASRDAQWTEALTAAGHPVLFPDSFGSRGLGSQCRVRDRIATSSGLRREDAILAATWLAAHPAAAPGGVVVLGWSDGGSTVIATAGRPFPAAAIRGFVAFYPGCFAARAPDWRPGRPLLILHGEADDWTPIAPCRAVAEKVGPLVTLHAYPGAHHDFDAVGPLRTLTGIPSPGGGTRTVHAGQDPTARADALLRVPLFISGLR